MARMLVTTLDNPFNPFTHFDDWNRFDMENKYFTCSYLARIAKTSTALSDEANQEIINRAVEDIVRLNITGNYRTVTEEDHEPVAG